MSDGSVLVLELGTASLLRASGEGYTDRAVVAKDLTGPVQMALGNDGAVYVTQATGTLVRVDLSSGDKTAIASELAMPEGLTETPWGTFVVVETAGQRLTEIDPKSGTKTVVAEHLPVGMPSPAGMPPAYMPTGVACASDGTLYVTSDLNNALLMLRPRG